VLDRNFGVFSVAWHAHQKKHPLVIRMTDVRARSLNGGKLPSQADQLEAQRLGPARPSPFARRRIVAAREEAASEST
jgi:hypothetical protein